MFYAYFYPKKIITTKYAIGSKNGIITKIQGGVTDSTFFQKKKKNEEKLQKMLTTFYLSRKKTGQANYSTVVKRGQSIFPTPKR